jgi:hypothetical protein
MDPNSGADANPDSGAHSDPNRRADTYADFGANAYPYPRANSNRRADTRAYTRAHPRSHPYSDTRTPGTKPQRGSYPHARAFYRAHTDAYAGTNSGAVAQPRGDP